MRRNWTTEEDEYLRQAYGSVPMPQIEAHISRTRNSIWNRAQKLCLHRPLAFMQAQGRHYTQHPEAIAHRFTKGHAPSNKGKHWSDYMSAEGAQRSRRTQFKKGQAPHNTKPVGYESVHKDGYVYIKIADGKRMVQKSRYVWQQQHGAIPPGMCIGFKDGNRQNCDISNLELFPVADKTRRVLAAMTPEQMKARAEKATATRAKSIARDKMLIRWGMEPKGKLVKRWYAYGT